MDQEVLVSAGKIIIRELTSLGLPPRAALWIHATDTDTWKLWIVPNKSLKDKREFYRHLSAIVTKNRSDLGGIDAADMEMVEASHPVITGLGRVMKVTTGGVISAKKSVYNGYYLEEALILEMNL